MILSNLFSDFLHILEPPTRPDLPDDKGGRETDSLQGVLDKNTDFKKYFAKSMISNACSIQR